MSVTYQPNDVLITQRNSTSSSFVENVLSSTPNSLVSFNFTSQLVTIPTQSFVAVQSISSSYSLSSSWAPFTDNPNAVSASWASSSISSISSSYLSGNNVLYHTFRDGYGASTAMGYTNTFNTTNLLNYTTMPNTAIIYLPLPLKYSQNYHTASFVTTFWTGSNYTASLVYSVITYTMNTSSAIIASSSFTSSFIVPSSSFQQFTASIAFNSSSNTLVFSEYSIANLSGLTVNFLTNVITFT